MVRRRGAAGERSGRFNLRLEADKGILKQESQDGADAVVACITMAYAATQYGIDGEWKRQHSWIGGAEWERRLKEGLVVRIA